MSNWKIINNYPHYMISDNGEIKSLSRKNGAGTRIKERILKPDFSSRGYSRVTLSNEKGIKRYSVHRLVALHFIPNPENKPFINHIDNNPRNNNVSNLEWCTHSENMIHAQKQNRLFESQQKGGQITAEIKQKEAEHYYAYSMGIRFIKTEVINSRRYVYYICPTCLNETKTRADQITNPLTKECNKCSRTKAMKKAWDTRRKQDEDIV